MLFITNRVLQEGPTSSTVDGNLVLPRSVNFNLRNNQAEQSVYFCRRNNKDDYTEIGGTAFLSELKNSNAQEILIYVHGFANLPEPAIFPRAEELQRLFDQKAPGYMVVVPVIWPCDSDDSQLKDYFDDQMAADQSGMAFARMFQKFLDWRDINSTIDNPCIKRINILAHSMGNRVLRATFSSIVQYFLPQGMPLMFRNIFMAAPDIVNEALEPGQEGQFIPTAARNVVVYYASDDLAMRASKVANLGNRIASRRLGHTGPEHMDKVSKNVYALDCDDFNTVYDPPTGHGYFASDRNGNPGILFDHMWRCIDIGRVPMSPSNARSAILRREWLE
ncbi:alpha/beta hydrolase [Tumidithrix elongata RA019]|uniref:Alpha/beta hydrolase n=1 Tax=Tumidithrix elongata BACA0141 TaxID=2716417 RepID=A0AAW9PSQ5_9CYAN|nr:alpha/beta hydrolase [Tumidithrix elongata RA019]